MHAQGTRGINTGRDYLLPFIQASISKFDGDIFDVEKVCEELLESFKLDVPIYLVNSLINKLEELGALEKNDVLNSYTCKDTVSNENKDETDIFAVLENSLNAFALKFGFDKPLYSDTWQEAMLLFFSGDSPKSASVKIKGKIVSEAKEKDDVIISKYILNCECSNSFEFEIFKKVYAAYSLADTLITIERPGRAKDWSKFSVIYDATVMMRLLGTSGNLLRKATLQVHECLRDIGCQTYYFNHNLQEVYDNVNAIIVGMQSGGHIHHETSKAAEEGEIDIAVMQALLASLETRLGELGITEIQLPNRMSNFAGQINPNDLESALKASIQYSGNQNAPVIDAHSIENILSLRRGKKFRDIENCISIFVTHNPKYARVTSNYCKSKCGYLGIDIPPIITLNSLSRLAWLANQHDGVEFDVTSELISNCYQAALPDSNWIQKFWSIVKNADPNLLNDDYKESLYLLSLREDLETETLGNSALLSEIDTPEIIRRIKQYQESQEAIRSQELESYKRELEKQKELSRREKAQIAEKFAMEQKTKLSEVELRHNIDLKDEISRTEKSTKEDILRIAERKAEIFALRITKVIKAIFVTVLFFYWINYYLNPQANMQSKNFLFWVVLTLSIIQFIGFFYKEFSVFFLELAIKRQIKKLFISILE